MKQHIYWMIFLFYCSVISCKQDLPSALSKDGPVPDPVSNVRAESRPGGAKLTYDIPNAADLLYVKAEWEYPTGVKKETKASIYADTLLVEGLGNEQEREITLFAVSKSEKFSAPVTVKIQPMTPSVTLVGSSLSLKEAFGGVTLNFLNPLGSDIVITVMKLGSEGWEDVESFYTKMDAGSFSTRGLASEATRFGVVVRDKWRNYSDTLIRDLTPLFETIIPDPIPITYLPSDYNKHFSNLNYTYMFNNNYNDYSGTLLGPGSDLPSSFTLDFGKPTRFSRLKLWQVRGTATRTFNYCAPKEIEIWGSNTLSDDWANWTKITEHEFIKPSGLPLGQISALDEATANAGLDVDFPENADSYRYIRWKTITNFGGIAAVQIAELKFWGSQ